MKLKVNPTIQPDRYSVDLDLRPEVIEFEGFINYGTPIEQTGQTSGTVITENKIQQPIFHTMKTTTAVVMQSGQSVVFGGLGSSGKRPGESTKNFLPTNAPVETPKTKDLIFFIIQASIIEGSKVAPASKVVAISNVAPTVTIFGQVRRQGKYELKPGMTVNDLIALAGPSAIADKTKAELIRGNDPFSAKLMLNLTQEGTKLLMDDDVITVPSS